MGGPPGGPPLDSWIAGVAGTGQLTIVLPFALFAAL